VNRTVLAALAALALLACGKPKPAPQAQVAAAAPQAAAPADAAAETAKKPAEPEWSYTSVGKRDPFRSILIKVPGAGELGRQTCPTPLGKFELEQFKLVAVITGLEDPVAMVEAPNGVGYAIRRGACIGKNGGTVAEVLTGEVVVAEWAVRADGTRDRTKTTISLPKREALNLEDQP